MLFKVYINQNRIKDTLRTFKMEVFVTKTIGEVIFSWQMILHKQYRNMNFLCFMLISCILHLLLGGSNLFQVVPACFSIGGSSSFLVLVCTVIFTFFKTYLDQILLFFQTLKCCITFGSNV